MADSKCSYRKENTSRTKLLVPVKRKSSDVERIFQESEITDKRTEEINKDIKLGQFTEKEL